MALNRFVHHQRTPRSKWTGALRVVPPAVEYEAGCTACGYEGRIVAHHCPECCRFVAKPREPA